MRERIFLTVHLQERPLPVILFERPSLDFREGSMRIKMCPRLALANIPDRLLSGCNEANVGIQAHRFTAHKHACRQGVPAFTVSSQCHLDSSEN